MRSSALNLFLHIDGGEVGKLELDDDCEKSVTMSHIDPSFSREREGRQKRILQNECIVCVVCLTHMCAVCDTFMCGK